MYTVCDWIFRSNCTFRKDPERGEAAVEQYKKFLKGGSSMYPLELLRLAGVDMEQKKPVEDALLVFSEYLDEMERLA